MEALIEGLIEVFGEIFLEIIAALIGTFFDYLNENSKIQPINPYACAKAYAFWLAKSYRQRGLFIVNGIAFAHESRRRPAIFVTRKITKAIKAEKSGLKIQA